MVRDTQQTFFFTGCNLKILTLRFQNRDQIGRRPKNLRNNFKVARNELAFSNIKKLTFFKILTKPEGRKI